MILMYLLFNRVLIQNKSAFQKGDLKGSVCPGSMWPSAEVMQLHTSQGLGLRLLKSICKSWTHSIKPLVIPNEVGIFPYTAHLDL